VVCGAPTAAKILLILFDPQAAIAMNYPSFLFPHAIIVCLDDLLDQPMTDDVVVPERNTGKPANIAKPGNGVYKATLGVRWQVDLGSVTRYHDL
jgi:hypothetical protein